MNQLPVHAHVLDIILAGMVLEAVALTALFRLRGRGVAPGLLLPNLASGACLLLAMRLGLSGRGLATVGLCLLGALAMHLLDLRRRWPTARG